MSVPAETRDDDATPSMLWADRILLLAPAERRAFLDAVVCLSRDAADAAREAEEARAELERLRPPPTRAERLAQRDDAIRQALASLYPDALPSAAAEALAHDWGHYLSTGWARECDLLSLPEGASLRRRTLHKLARLNRGRALTWRQVWNIANGFRTP